MEFLPVFLTLLFWIKIEANQEFSFHQFENFVLNKETFNDEKKLVKQLGDHKAKLWELKEEIINRELSPNFRKVLVKLKEMKKTKKNFSSEQDLDGAFRGLILLQETYQLDPVFWLSGTLQFKNQIYPCSKMASEDLKKLAFIAFKNQWYDNCITYLRAILPNLDPESLKLKFKVVELHNKLVSAKKSRISKQDSKVFPYLVNEETLLKKSKQPKWIKKVQWFTRSKDFKHGLQKEDGFRQICNGKFQDFQNSQQKCFWLHHFDPFLKLCPFKLEELWMKPYRAKIYDFLSNGEIQHFIQDSRPHLSRARQSSRVKSKNEQNVNIVVKSVQHWTDDLVFRQNVTYTYNEKAQGYQVYQMMNNLDQDFYSYDIKDEILFKISQRIQLATQTDVISRFSSSRYQVTNYGLGGVCETHTDPGGYIMSRPKAEPENPRTVSTGDIFLTVMGWLNSVKAGGGTAFDHPHKSQLVEPTKGAIALWFGLESSGHLEQESSHGGCPILMGSKWIFNKWINSFDQWKSYPCLKYRDYIQPFIGKY